MRSERQEGFQLSWNHLNLFPKSLFPEIEPKAKKVSSLKSTNHFYAAYAPIARTVLYTDGGGPSPLDIRRLPYRHIERPLWPLDPLPPGRLLV
jgi:microcystin degradation protein MlrC